MRRLISSCCGLLAACLPSDGEDPSRAYSPRIIAFVATPTEITPNASVTVEALTSGEPLEAFTWARCTSARPLTENAAVAAVCAKDEQARLPCDGASCTFAVPADSCARFGPNVQETVRPAAPDASGGFYLPVRVQYGADQVSVFRLRLRCPLAAAPIAVVRDFARRYTTNVAPGVTSVRAGRASGVLAIDVAVVPGETYVLYRQGRAALSTQREQRDARWYVSAGSMVDAAQEVVGDALHNRWLIEPGERGTAWLVLRDDRGAAGVFTIESD